MEITEAALGVVNIRPAGYVAAGIANATIASIARGVRRARLVDALAYVAGASRPVTWAT